jgi:hypothetical protein
MVFMTMTLLAATIAVMFVTTAVTSIVNSVREHETARQVAIARQTNRRVVP